MALSILDGNQSATTLSTILTSGQHITAHTVVSLGTQAITDMRSAVSGSVVSISNLPATQPVSIASVTIGNTVTIAGTVTANPTGTQTIAGTVTANLAGSFNQAIETVSDVSNASQAVAVHLYDDGGTFMGNLNNPFYVSGTVTVGNTVNFLSGSDTDTNLVENIATALASNTILGITNALPAGTNRIGVVTIGGGTVTIGAGTAQIGSVTANLAYSQTATTIASTAVTAIPVVFPTSGAYGGSLQGYNGTNTYIYSGIQAIGGTSLASATSLPVSLSTLPALVSGTAQIGSVTASISNTAVTVYSAQGTTVTNSNFTSLTSSTSLVSAVVGRDVLTVFNEGAGNLYISPGATCTTISYQVRLSSGDYWECPAGQLSLAHTAVFATAGTARITEVS